MKLIAHYIKHIIASKAGCALLNALVVGLFLGVVAEPMISLALVGHDNVSGLAIAQSEDKKKKKKRAKQALQIGERAYKKLSDAQKKIEEGNIDGAISVLNSIKKDAKAEEHAKAMAWSIEAFALFSREDYNGTIKAYKQVLSFDVPDNMKEQTLFYLAQVYLQQDKPKMGIQMMEKWLALVPEPSAQGLITLGQAYYMTGNYKQAINYTERAVKLKIKQGGVPGEQWLLILRAGYYELGNTKRVVEVLQDLVKYYPKGSYFLQLSGMYGQMDEETKQLLVLEASYDGGYFSRENEYVSLASLLVNAEVPYKAAKVLTEGIDKKIVKEKVNVLRLLAQAWILAQEPKKSIRVLRKAAQLSDDGELYVLLGRSHMNLDEWDECVRAIRNGIKKGGLRRVDSAWGDLGVCLFNIDELDGAISAFKKASKDKRSKEYAKTWIDYLRNEKVRRAGIAQSLI